MDWRVDWRVIAIMFAALMLGWLIGILPRGGRK
jgi:hypothetical protein